MKGRSFLGAAAAMLAMSASTAGAARETEIMDNELREAKLRVPPKATIRRRQRQTGSGGLHTNGKPVGTVVHFWTEAHKRKFRMGVITELQATHKVPILYGAERSLTRSYFKSKRYTPNGARECARRVRQMENAAAA